MNSTSISITYFMISMLNPWWNILVNVIHFWTYCLQYKHPCLATPVTLVLVPAIVDWSVLLLTGPLGSSRLGFMCSLGKLFNRTSLFYAHTKFCNSDPQLNFIQQPRIKFPEFSICKIPENLYLRKKPTVR